MIDEPKARACRKGEEHLLRGGASLSGTSVRQNATCRGGKGVNKHACRRVVVSTRFPGRPFSEGRKGAGQPKLLQHGEKGGILDGTKGLHKKRMGGASERSFEKKNQGQGKEYCK